MTSNFTTTFPTIFNDSEALNYLNNDSLFAEFVSNNSDNNSLPYIPMASRPERFLVPIVFALIFLVGVIGNGALVFFFIKHPSMRNVPNTYILSLAIGDLLVLVFTVPFVSLVFTLEDFPFGEVMCKMQEAMRDISIGVTVFTLTALSVNRYYAIVKPWGKRSDQTTNAIVTNVSIWLLSITLAVPAASFTSLRYFEKSNSETFASCFPFPDYLGPYYPRFNVLAKFLIYYLIPLLIIATFYTLMAMHLMKQNIPGEVLPQQRNFIRQTETRKKVAKLVLAFVFIFALCFFPNNLFMMWFYFHPTSEDDYNYTWNAIRIIGFCLTFINSCINPIALYWISGTFRKYYNRHLFCSKKEDIVGTSFSQYRFHSSIRNHFNATVRTEQYEMSSAANIDNNACLPTNVCL